MMSASCLKSARVMAVAGSSGGHIFPAVSLLDSLRESEPSAEVLLLLPRRSIKDRIGVLEYPVVAISIIPVKLGLDLRNLIAILRFLKGSFEELTALLKFRPNLVVGFGSISSIPLVLFARMAGIKTLIHEQNVIPGRANRFLAFFADKIALSFADTGVYLKCPKEKLIVTGNPLRRQMAPLDKTEARGYFGLSRDKFTILVSGGSQSSSNINEGFLKVSKRLRGRFSFQLIHLAGRNDCEHLREEYERSGIEARVFSFLDAMQYAYSASDAAVSRAGATTIAELIFFRLPAILVP
ncbi:MAG: UDP-N-acetylglucosamine--N-acetylmuramyl-(pentapeptide) pyrophosphoryl-undecaprenol N-acetylglucosamine transferase, partial [Candidatus Omnitrophota bacterium]